VIAARLILIKSKSLLPTLELSSEEEKDINDLKKHLEIYRLFKEASQNIKDQYQKNPTFSKEFLFNQTPIFIRRKILIIIYCTNHLKNLGRI
jgi:chromatin segregation and condensation protein Rec8/ScpA/Scc1 (kleisin family)